MFGFRFERGFTGQNSMTESQQLLAAYAKDGSETAFRELTARYLNLVYSTALRMTGGDAHLAQDVTQTVFIQLAQNAHKLSRDTALGGWLHRTTCNAAINVLRGERRRIERETQAVLMNAQTDSADPKMEDIAPMLDEAINQLAEEDRAAILLRFFEQLDFRAVGQVLGSKEDAARMRVNRAVEKLAGLLKRRGVVLSTAVLGTMLTTSAVSAAPAGVSSGIASTALATASVLGSGAGMGFLQLMTQTKAIMAGALLVTGLAGVAVWQHQDLKRLEQEGAVLKKQAAELSDKLEQLKHPPTVTMSAQVLTDAERLELLRLRGEMGLMRDQLANSKRRQEDLKDSYKLVVSALDKETVAKIEREHLNQTMMNAKQWLVAFQMYATENKDRFPTAFEQTKDFMGDGKGQEILKKVIEQFEFFPIPDLKDSSPTDLVILRGNPIQLSSGSWMKVYGFADGHVEALDSVNGDFTTTEVTRKLVYPPRLE